MQFAILKINSGPSAGRKSVIRPGQILRVGRAFDVDFSIPEDPELADVHFVFDATQHGCQVRCFPQFDLLFGEESATERAVYSGDTFRAGTTEFLIQIEGDIPAAPAAAEQGGNGAAEKPTPPKPQAPLPPVDLGAIPTSQILAKSKPKEITTQICTPEMTAMDLMAALAEKKAFDQCVKLLASALPKPHAVWWAADCVEETAGDKLTPTDEAALAAARAWVLDPSDENSRAAEAAAKPIQMSSAAGATALAAFWSGSSIGLPEFDPVPPAEHLTAQAVYAALEIVSVEGEGRIPNLTKFYEAGLKIAEGTK